MSNYGCPEDALIASRPMLLFLKTKSVHGKKKSISKLRKYSILLNPIILCPNVEHNQ